MKKCLFFIVLMMLCLVSSVHAIDNSVERTPEEKKIDEMFIQDTSKLDPADAMATAKLGDEYIDKAMTILHRDKTSMVHEGWEYYRKGLALYEKASKIAKQGKSLGYVYYRWANELEWIDNYVEAWQKIKLARKYDASVIEEQFIKKLSKNIIEPDNDVVAALPEALGLTKILFLTLSVDKSKTYVDDPLNISIQMYVSKLNLVNIQPPSLMHNELSQAKFGEPRQYRKKIDGLNYDVLEFNAKISAAKPGNYKIGPAKTSCYVLIGNPKEHYEAYFVELNSQEVGIEILPSPSKDGSKNDKNIGDVSKNDTSQ